MKLSKFYRKAVASIESKQQQELHAAVESGDLSDAALNISSHITASAESVADVVRAHHRALEDTSNASELREVGMEALDLRDAVVAFNDAGGVRTDALFFANAAAAAVFDRVGGMKPFKAPATESIGEDGRFAIGLEDFDEIVVAVDEAREEVGNKSVDSVRRVYTALQKALPEVKDRMVALQQSLGVVQYDEEKQIRLDNAIAKNLMVNGQLPSSMKDYFLGYGRFAEALLGPYSENAVEAASKSPQIGDSLEQLDDNACPIEALSKTIAAIGDPRGAIAPDQLGFVLPGSGPLFGAALSIEDETQADVPEGPAGDLIVRLQRFNDDHAPLDPMSYDERPDAPAAENGESPMIRVLSKDSIATGLEVLCKIIDGVSIASYAEARADSWVKARSSFERYRQSLQCVTPTQAASLRPVTPVLGEYCDTLFTLSVWPALNLLCNVLFTSNAFVLFAERSISGVSEDVANTALPEDVEVDEVDVTLDEPVTPDADTPTANGGEVEGGSGVVAETPEESASAPDETGNIAGGPLGTAPDDNVDAPTSGGTAQVVSGEETPESEPTSTVEEEEELPTIPEAGEEPEGEPAAAAPTSEEPVAEEAAPAAPTESEEAPAAEPTSAAPTESAEGEPEVIPAAEEEEEEEEQLNLIPEADEEEEEEEAE